MSGPIVSAFGYRVHPIYGDLRLHTGVDIDAACGEPIIAASGGRVFLADWKGGYGLTVMIDHGGGMSTLYGHLSDVAVGYDQQVVVGEVIGYIGTTGVSTGCHLHFEVRVGDPYDYGATRNPELWIVPFYEYGTLAGRVVDGSGALLYEHPLTVHGEDLTRFVLTYADSSVNPDDYWGENFVAGDLPAGNYTVVVKIGSRKHERTVRVEPGRITWIEFQGEE